MNRGPRASLPAMGKSYQGVRLLLQLVAQYHPTLEELKELVAQHMNPDLQGLIFLSGHEDILQFCNKQLGLFDTVDHRFHLSERGGDLYGRLYSREFGASLFSHLVECSKQNFTYFYRVYEALELRVKENQLELAKSAFNSMLLIKSNRRSSKEIRGLLLGCGAVHEKGNSIVIVPSFFTADLHQKQLGDLWSTTSSLITEERLTYSELKEKLKLRYPSLVWDEFEGDFYAGLVVSRTRASEYVDGVRDNTKQF